MKIFKAVLVFMAILVTFFLNSPVKAEDNFSSENTLLAGSSAFGSRNRPIELPVEDWKFQVFPGYDSSGIGFSREVYVSFNDLYVGTDIERSEVILQNPKKRKNTTIGYVYPRMAEKGKKIYQTVYFPEGKEMIASWQFYFADKPETEDHVLKIKFHDEGLWYHYAYSFSTPDVRATAVIYCVDGSSELMIHLEPFFGNAIDTGNIVTMDIEERLMYTKQIDGYWYSPEQGYLIPWYSISHSFSPEEIALIEGTRQITLAINNGQEIFKTKVAVEFYRCQ